jgi:hypothetical protein
VTAIAVLPSTPPRHTRWHDPGRTVAAVPALRWIRIDPNLRGRVSPSSLARFRAAGLCVHRVGAAAYVHDAERRHRWILVVVPRDDAPVPAFAARLEGHHRWLRRRGGAPLPAEARRQAAADAAFLELDRLIPWWKVRADW